MMLLGELEQLVSSVEVELQAALAEIERLRAVVADLEAERAGLGLAVRRLVVRDASTVDGKPDAKVEVDPEQETEDVPLAQMTRGRAVLTILDQRGPCSLAELVVFLNAAGRTEDKKARVSVVLTALRNRSLVSNVGGRWQLPAAASGDIAVTSDDVQPH